MANRSNENETEHSNRGFASMDPERQREIASKGGHAARLCCINILQDTDF